MGFNQNDNLCRWCGRNEATDEHHLFRRSTSPGMVDDPNNKVKLCRTCHRYATDEQEFERLLQEYFFLKPEVTKLTKDYIAERMKDGDMLSPRDVTRFRNFLAGEYSFLNDRFVDLEKKKPFAVEDFKKNEGVKSEARAERLYQMTEDGVLYGILYRELKVIEKMLSALRTTHEQYQAEGRNTF